MSFFYIFKYFIKYILLVHVLFNVLKNLLGPNKTTLTYRRWTHLKCRPMGCHVSSWTHLNGTFLWNNFIFTLIFKTYTTMQTTGCKYCTRPQFKTTQSYDSRLWSCVSLPQWSPLSLCGLCISHLAVEPLFPVPAQSSRSSQSCWKNKHGSIHQFLARLQVRCKQADFTQTNARWQYGGVNQQKHAKQKSMLARNDASNFNFIITTFI